MVPDGMCFYLSECLAVVVLGTEINLQAWLFDYFVSMRIGATSK